MGRIGEHVTQRLDLVPAGWAGAAGAACVARARAPRCDALHDNGWLALLDVLHLNFEFDAKCLSRKTFVLKPVRIPHNSPHSPRLLARAGATQ